MTPTCEFCRKTRATQTLSFSSKCVVVQKPVCDACSRSLQLPHPFTLQPLPGTK